MDESCAIPAGRSRRPWRAGVLLLCAGCLAGLVLWVGKGALARREPLFRGKPESEWIKNLKYWDDEQVKEWRTYGEEGVQVLIRGLQNANRPGERAYRKYSRVMPAYLRGWLPAPKPDSTRVTRMCLVSLLASLGNAASNAVPIMLRTVRDDESDSVRQGALNYFNSTEDDHCLLNRLPAAQKLALLPALIRGIQDPGNWGLRNNAAISLRYYPEQRERVAPVLVKALQDSQPQVRLLAAEALNRVDPAAAKKAGATAIVAAIAKNPDDQIASHAVAALRGPGTEPELAVPVLLECLQSTNTLVACEAVWALQWAPQEFAAYSETIIPALRSAAQRKDNVGGYAKVALSKWMPQPGPAPGAK